MRPNLNVRCVIDDAVSKIKPEERKGIYILRNIKGLKILFSVLLAVFLLTGGRITKTYADEPSPTPTVTEAPKENSTMIKDGVSDSYLGEVTEGINETFTGLVKNDEETVNKVVQMGMRTMEKVIYYIPFIGIGIFLFGAGIAVFSILNKSNRRWGVRMAVICSIVLYIAYIFFILIYNIHFLGRQPGELIRPETLDHYGRVYFGVWEEVLNAERLAGLADKTLSRDIIAVLINFYKESAFDIGVVVFGFGLLLSVIMKRNPVIKKWARFVLCFIVPIVLYIGYWYVSRLN